MFKLFLPVLLMIFLFTGLAQADFYKWEDEEGNIHITDYPPPTKSVKKLKVHETESNADRSVPASPQKTAEPSRPSGRQQGTRPQKAQEVILYTTSWCPYCKKAKDFFSSRNIHFTEYDIEKDPEAARRKKTLDPGRGVPFAIVNGQSISGYSPAEYEAALKRNE